MNFGSALEQVHRRAPLVDCITNFVTVNDCANILLAVGGSPTMASDIREVQETAAAASALLCNLGAIDKVESMILGGQAANRAGKPVVFDPVGAGNTSLRRAESARLLDAVQFAVIRGNASEIRALAQRRAAGSGVDVSDADQIDGEDPPPHRGFCQSAGSADRGRGGRFRPHRRADGRQRNHSAPQRLRHHVPRHGQRLYAHRPHGRVLRGHARPTLCGGLRGDGDHGGCGRAGRGPPPCPRHRQRHVPHRPH